MLQLRTTLLVTASLLASLICQGQILWKVTPPTSPDKPSYILGTHHLAPVTLLDTLSGFNQAINRVQVVYGELDMLSAADPTNAGAMARLAMAPADSTLSHIFTPSQLAEIDSAMQANDLPMTTQMLNAMKPAVIEQALTMAIGTRAVPDFDPTHQLDTQVQTMARAQGKEIRGLETMEFQANLLMGSPVTSQAESLLKLVEQGVEGIETMHRLTKAYLQGDLNALDTLIGDPDTGFSQADRERLITSRNRQWARLLSAAIPSTMILAAVGAGHLGGREGLLQLLKDQGFKVTPVTKK